MDDSSRTHRLAGGALLVANVVGAGCVISFDWAKTAKSAFAQSLMTHSNQSDRYLTRRRWLEIPRLAPGRQLERCTWPPGERFRLVDRFAGRRPTRRFKLNPIFDRGPDPK